MKFDKVDYFYLSLGGAAWLFVYVSGVIGSL